MRIEITQELNDDGKPVFAWFVMRGDETLGGGYGATEADARNDAESFLANTCDEARPLGAVASGALLGACGKTAPENNPHKVAK